LPVRVHDSVRAYGRAAELVRTAPVQVAQLVCDGRVQELKGIGPAIERCLRELTETGDIVEMVVLRRSKPLELAVAEDASVHTDNVQRFALGRKL
jgi:DNA polymerase/3'-5' exonuclease PolX